MSALFRTLTAAGVLALLAGPLAAQAPDASSGTPLDHEAYDIWNRIQDEALSPDGRWLVYRLQPGDGDATVVVRSVDGTAELRVERGEAPAFTDDSRWVVLTVNPAEEAVEEAEERREDDRSVEVPKDSLAVVDLEALTAGGGSAAVVHRAAEVESFRVPEEGAAVLAYLLEPEPEDDEDDDAGGEGEEAGEQEAQPAAGEAEEKSPREKRREDKDDGSVLVLRDLASGAEHRFEHATDYSFDEAGTRLYYAASSRDGTADGVYRVDTDGGAASPLLTGEGRYVQLAVSAETGQVAFLTDRDDQEVDKPALALWTAEADDDGARPLVAAEAAGIPADWWIGEKGEVRFSEAGTRIFFGIVERPSDDDDDDEEESDDEEVVLDVWNWQDGYLQPMQLVQAERNADRTFLATVPADGGAVVQLATDDLPDVTVADDGDGEVAIAETDRPYRHLLSWDGRYNDVWLIDVDSGEREPVIEKIRGFGGGSMSPAGRYVTWWDGDDRHWYALDTDTRRTVRLTEGSEEPLWDQHDDRPEPPGPHGAAGWTEDGRFLVYDAHDVWLVDPASGAAPVNVTEGVGRSEGLRFRYVRTDPEADFVPTDEDVLLASFHLTTKEDGLWRDRFDAGRPPVRLVEGDYSLGFPRKAEDADRFLLTRETFVEFPDLYVAGPDFDDMERVSDANPQQSGYRWGTAELVEWMSADGIPLQGILYKPDGFDPGEQHPMMVYFYERSSDGLHGHHVPSAGSSSINRSFYVSRGYLLFVPDIPYEIGFPGESALDAVVPGVLALIDEGFVDPDRIGVQGHSWGGYQIAHMITRTHLFAAAEAGAPVANMTSAYGGIRWGSGMSRMFQYERTQSRIGGTLWNAQHRYIENSPLFFADKIETPLLMMHNDEDGAVPWYQGIEMFVAMRRLGKPVFMLNYNGEDHGLRQEHNRKDWAVRMQQFFDHYLKDAPPPVWMAEGVPAELKGETLGLELVTEAGKPVTEEGGSGNR